MTDVRISVLTDPETQTDGGAILRLTGVALVPPGSTFRIDPIDDDGPPASPEGWPAGDLKPRGQRITKDGVDLVIGSDVVEAAALLPGTPVTVSVPAVGARAELRWPSLPVARREPRHAVVMSGEQRAAELATKAAARAEAERIKAEEAAQAFAAGKATEAPPPAPTAALSSLTLTPEAKPNASATAKPAPEKPDSLSRLKPPAAPELPVPRSPGTPGPPAPKPAPLKPVLAGSATGAGRAAVPPAAGDAPRAAAVARADAGSSNSGRGRGSFWSGAALPFALGCVFAGAAAVVIPALSKRPAGGSTALTAPATPAALPPTLLATPDRTGSFAAPRLTEILTVPDVSPQGEPAAKVSLEEALRRADQGLYGTGGRLDRQEAKFWLRKALSVGLGDQRLLWAMTQLGTLYASPEGGAPDYASARLLWELAAAKGDPVANCFLASVAENGLDGPRDTRQALALYERAKALGGCRDVDEAITRLRKSAP